MKKSNITYIVGSVFATMTVFFYCCAMWFPIKLPRYYPLEHAWKWGGEEGIPSQGWYSMQAFAYLAAGVVALVAYLVLKHGASKKVNLNPALIKSLGVITTAIIIVCMVYMLYYEFDKWGVFKSVFPR